MGASAPSAADVDRRSKLKKQCSFAASVNAPTEPRKSQPKSPRPSTPEQLAAQAEDEREMKEWHAQMEKERQEEERLSGMAC